MERIQQESLVTVAASQLRNAIVTGEMQPGEAIPVKVLQERLGISHIPIREALRLLESEGLVVAPPRRMPMVAEVALDDLAAIYKLRIMIEIPTAREAIAGATPEDAAQVQEAFDAFARVDNTSAPEYWECHSAFHWSLVQRGATAWTRRLLDPLWRGSERYVRLFVAMYSTADHAMALHVELLEGYLSGKPDRLEKALRKHFAETERVVSEGYHANANGG
jgi:DNA-binding GntR family transcriptional regulator